MRKKNLMCESILGVALTLWFSLSPDSDDYISHCGRLCLYWIICKKPTAFLEKILAKPTRTIHPLGVGRLVLKGQIKKKSFVKYGHFKNSHLWYVFFTFLNLLGPCYGQITDVRPICKCEEALVNPW